MTLSQPLTDRILTDSLLYIANRTNGASEEPIFEHSFFFYIEDNKASNFKNSLCKELETAFTYDPVGIDVFAPDTITARFELPDCFWKVSSRFVYFHSNARLLIKGKAKATDGTSDPLVRLTGPNTNRLEITNANFENPSSSGINGTYIPDWTTITTNRPVLKSLTIDRSNIGGPLPGNINLQTVFVVTNSRLSGTIPASLFSTFNSRNSVRFSFANNALTGTIPQNLLSGLVTSTMTTFSVDFSNNQLSGTIPSDLISRISAAALTSAEVNLSKNQLVGSLPSLANQFAPQVLNMALDATHNAITGTISSTYLDSIGLKTTNLPQPESWFQPTEWCCAIATEQSARKQLIDTNYHRSVA